MMWLGAVIKLEYLTVISHHQSLRDFFGHRNLRFCNHAALTIRCKIYVQAIKLERNPTRVEIERELACDKYAPRRLIPKNDTSPSSRESNAQP